MPTIFSFVDVLLLQPELDGVAQQVVVVVDVHVEVGAVLDGEANVFVVSEAGVFDGVDAGENRVLDTLRSVRVRGDLASSLVSFFGGDLQLFE